jgi:hypothetical protein
MGWYATCEALVNGVGPYGTVKQSLRRIADPTETVRVALGAVDGKVRSGSVTLDRRGRARVAYWKRWSGYERWRGRQA